VAGNIGPAALRLAELSVRLLTALRDASSSSKEWDALWARFTGGAPAKSLHVAVLLEPYLTYILEGRKTVESRFSVRPVAPYRRVGRSDVVLLKEPAGPIVAACEVAAVWSYHLDPESWDEVKDRFGGPLCAEGSFWQDRRNAEYATLMRIQAVTRLPPLSIPKRDRRGWVILVDGRKPRLL
jgi:hypothetical protein